VVVLPVMVVLVDNLQFPVRQHIMQAAEVVKDVQDYQVVV
jgi:hypothetical protein